MRTPRERRSVLILGETEIRYDSLRRISPGYRRQIVPKSFNFEDSRRRSSCETRRALENATQEGGDCLEAKQWNREEAAILQWEVASLDNGIRRHDVLPRLRTKWRNRSAISLRTSGMITHRYATSSYSVLRIWFKGTSRNPLTEGFGGLPQGTFAV